MNYSSTLGEDLRFGSWGKGTLAVITSLFSIVILPLVLIYIVEGLITEMGLEEELLSVFDPMMEMIWRFAIYGLPVVALAFFKKSYDKGSKAKLLFNLISLAYSILWIYFIFDGGAMTISVDTSSLFTDGDFSVENIDAVLMLNGFIIVMIGLILFKMLLAFTSYGSNREKYMEKFNETKADREYVPRIKTTFGYDLKHGSAGRGLGSAILKLILIMVIPYLIIHYSELIIEALELDTEMVEIFDVVLDLLYRIAFYGMPLVFLAFFTKFYEKGNKAWLMFRIIGLLYTIVWVWLIFEMGEFVLPFDTGILFEYGEYAFDGNDILQLAILIIVVYLLLKTVAALLTFRGKRKRYLRKLEESDGNQYRN